MTIRAELDNMRERVEREESTSIEGSPQLWSAVHRDRARLLDAVEKVLELHAPTEDNPPQCSTCQDYWYPSQNVEWPCETVTAITTALEGKDA